MAALPGGAIPYSPSYNPSTSSTSSSAIGVGTSRTQPSSGGLSLAHNSAARRQVVQAISEQLLPVDTQALRAEIRDLYLYKSKIMKIAPEAQSIVDRINNRGKLTDTIASALTATTVVRLEKEVAIEISQEKMYGEMSDALSRFETIFDSLCNWNWKNDPKGAEKIEGLKKELSDLLSKIENQLDANVEVIGISIDLHEVLYDGKLLLEDKQNKIPQIDGQYRTAYYRTATERFVSCQNRYEAILAAWENRQATDHFDDQLEDLHHLLKSLELLRKYPRFSATHKLTPELTGEIGKLCENIRDLINEITPVLKSLNNGMSAPVLCTINIAFLPGKFELKKMFKGQNFQIISKNIQEQYGKGHFFVGDSLLLDEYPDLKESDLVKQEQVLERIYHNLKLPIWFIPDNPNVRKNDSRVVVTSYRDSLKTSSSTQLTAISPPAPPLTSTTGSIPPSATPYPNYPGHMSPPVYRPAPPLPSTTHSIPPSATPYPNYPGHMSPSVYRPAPPLTSTTHSIPPSATPYPNYPGHMSPSVYRPAPPLTSTTGSIPPSTTPYPNYPGHMSPSVYRPTPPLPSTNYYASQSAPQLAQLPPRSLSSHTWTPITYQSGPGAITPSMGIPVSGPLHTTTLSSTSSSSSTTIPPNVTGVK